MHSFCFHNPAYPALLNSRETVPPGWLGPVAPTTQSCFYLDENGAATPGEWGAVSGQPNTPSGRLIYYTGTGGYLHTTGYAGGAVRLYAPGGQGAGYVRLVVTRLTTGEVLYDLTAQESQVDDQSYLLHEVFFPVFAAWRLEIIQATAAPINLTDVSWT